MKAALGESWRVTANVRVLLERGGVHQSLDMKNIGADWEDLIPGDCVRATLLRHFQAVSGRWLHQATAPLFWFPNYK